MEQAIKQTLDPAQIGKSELFNSLPERERCYVAAHSCIINVEKGAMLFSIGRKAEQFYMLLEGSIHVRKPRDDGGFDDLARYTPGDIIGDFDFARNAQHDANAEAAEDSVLVMFPATGLTMDDLAKEEPFIVSRILLNSVIMITGRVKSSHKLLLENLSWVNELHRRAYEDPGTGLWKQALITDEINRILEEPMALIMLKPDRFKILVDSRGHEAGDKAMVRIAMILKSFIDKIERGWAIRFKSNETGLLINNCPPPLALKVIEELDYAIAAMEPVPAEGEIPPFPFTGTIAWSIWPEDGSSWETLFQGTYNLMLETWKTGGGGQIAHYTRKEQP